MSVVSLTLLLLRNNFKCVPGYQHVTEADPQTSVYANIPRRKKKRGSCVTSCYLNSSAHVLCLTQEVQNYHCCYFLCANLVVATAK